MILIRTPLQVTLLGASTAQPDWSRKHGGLLLGGAINHYVFTAAYCDAGEPRIAMVHQSLLYASGLGAVAAQGAGTRVAYQAFSTSTLVDKDDPAFPFVNTGGVGQVRYRGEQASVLPLPRWDVVDELESHLLLVKLNGSPAEPTGFDRQGKEQFAILRSTEQAALCLERRDWAELGRNMDQALRAEVTLGSKAMSDEASSAYAAARLHGAFGGNLLGRYLLVLAPPEKHRTILDQSGHTHVPCRFEPVGSCVVYSCHEGC
jgi:hypothetical protein